MNESRASAVIPRGTRDARRRHAVGAPVPGEAGPGRAGGAGQVAPATRDERLRVLFACCHPDLSTEDRVVLSLRYVCGRPTTEIARLLAMPELTAASRLARASHRAAAVPYRLPGDSELPGRLDGVLALIHLMFTDGYGVDGPRLVRTGLCDVAIAMARLVVALLPDRPEAAGLLALILLRDGPPESRPSTTAGRHRWRGEPDDPPGAGVGGWNPPRRLSAGHRESRVYDDGRVGRHRSRRTTGVDEALELLDAVLRAGPPGPYTIQAAIAAEHARAATPAEVDWAAIVGRYDQLLRYTGSPVVRLNRAAAVAMADGPAAGLALLDELARDPALRGGHLLPGYRADMLRRLGHTEEAADAYRTARALAGTDVEREFYDRALAGEIT